MKTLISTSAVGATTTFGQRARAAAFSLLATGLLAVPATAYSAIVDIDFEGVAENGPVPVESFYDGSPLSYGVVFAGDNLAVEDNQAPGLFIANSGVTAMLLIADPNIARPETTLEFSQGFTTISFYYASLVAAMTYSVLDGDGVEITGDSLALVGQSCSSGIFVCNWTQVTLTNFDRVARAIVFSGPNGFAVIDDISLTPVPLPAAAWLLLSGLAGLGVFGRRRAVAA